MPKKSKARSITASEPFKHSEAGVIVKASQKQLTQAQMNIPNVGDKEVEVLLQKMLEKESNCKNLWGHAAREQQEVTVRVTLGMSLSTGSSVKFEWITQQAPKFQLVEPDHSDTPEQVREAQEVFNRIEQIESFERIHDLTARLTIAAKGYLADFQRGSGDGCMNWRIRIFRALELPFENGPIFDRIDEILCSIEECNPTTINWTGVAKSLEQAPEDAFKTSLSCRELESTSSQKD